MLSLINCAILKNIKVLIFIYLSLCHHSCLGFLEVTLIWLSEFNKSISYAGQITLEEITAIV